MAVLKHPTTSPPGGWKYRQAETLLTLDGDSLHALVDKVVSHRRYKGLKPDDPQLVNLEVQRQICTRLGTGECKPESEVDEWVPLPITPRFTLMDILAFSKTMLEFAKSGGKLVSKEELKRRADICRGCACNQPAQGCKCSIFYKMVNASVPSDRREPNLHICACCSCSLIGKTNMPASVLKADTRKINYPGFCWMKEI